MMEFWSQARKREHHVWNLKLCIILCLAGVVVISIASVILVIILFLHDSKLKCKCNAIRIEISHQLQSTIPKNANHITFLHLPLLSIFPFRSLLVSLSPISEGRLGILPGSLTAIGQGESIESETLARVLSAHVRKDLVHVWRVCKRARNESGSARGREGEITPLLSVGGRRVDEARGIGSGGDRCGVSFCS